MNQSHLRIAVGWRKMSFCQFQVQQGTFNKPVTAVRKHSFQGVRSNKTMIRPISPRTQSEMRQRDKQQHKHSPNGKSGAQSYTDAKLSHSPFIYLVRFDFLKMLDLFCSTRLWKSMKHLFTKCFRDSRDIFSVPCFYHFQVLKVWHL